MGKKGKQREAQRVQDGYDSGFGDQDADDGWGGLGTLGDWPGTVLPNDSASNVNPNSPAGGYRNPLEGGDRRSMAGWGATQNHQLLHQIHQVQQQQHQQHQQYPPQTQSKQQKPLHQQQKGRGRSNAVSKGRKADDGWGVADTGWANENVAGPVGGANGENDWANDGGGGADSGWGATNNNDWMKANDDGWGAPAASTAANGWGAPPASKGNDWASPLQQAHQGGGGAGGWDHAGRIPKVTITAPSADGARTGARTVLSPPQHSHLLSLLKKSQQGHGHTGVPSPVSVHGQGLDRQRGEGGKKIKRKKHHSPPRGWPMEEPIEEEPEGEMEDGEGYGHDERKENWFSDVGTHWDRSPSYSMPSKAFAMASEGRVPFSGRPRQENARIDAQFIESNGTALIPAEKALYSPERLARNRIHWQFDPYKDERVSSLLEWIQDMAYELARLGLHKFIQSRERGALITNADFRPESSPSEPAFDWITYADAERTKDRTLQESLAFNDPAMEVLVFVFLLSKSGNSMAMWRRKLIVPNNIRLTFGAQISQAKTGLAKQYPIYIDESPLPATPTETVAPKKKKKWFRWFR